MKRESITINSLRNKEKILLRERIKAIVSVVVGIFVFGGGKISELLLLGLGSPEWHRDHEACNHQGNGHKSDSFH